MRLLTATLAVGVLGMAMTTACSSSSSGSSSPTTVVTLATTAPGGAAGASASGPPTPASNVQAPTPASNVQAQTPAPSMTAAPSPTGVPGIAAADAFCAAWSRFGGSVQIIAVAVNFAGLTSVQSATLELEAAPTIVEAVTVIDGTWPTELATEHRAAVDDYLGPYARRAAKSVDALRGAGMTDARIAVLGGAWADVLATRDPDEPTVSVQLPADVAAEVDAGATAFDAAVTPWGADPSLSVNLDAIPLTKRYLSQHCPDLASTGVGDDV